MRQSLNQTGGSWEWGENSKGLCVESWRERVKERVWMSSLVWVSLGAPEALGGPGDLRVMGTEVHSATACPHVSSTLAPISLQRLCSGHWAQHRSPLAERDASTQWGYLQYDPGRREEGGCLSCGGGDRRREGTESRTTEAAGDAAS